MSVNTRHSFREEIKEMRVLFVIVKLRTRYLLKALLRAKNHQLKVHLLWTSPMKPKPAKIIL